MDNNQVVQKAFRSVKWSALASILPRFVTPISTLILAALLTPADFGIVAACMAVISLAQIVVEMGVGKAIIQRREQVDEAASVAFLLNMLLALILSGLLFILAPILANAYNIPQMASPLRLSSLALILAGLIGIPNALLTREMLFRRLFWVSAVPQIVTAITSVILAVIHPNYWALLIGYLVGRTTHAVLIWLACSWRPSFIVDWELVKSIFKFSSWILISSFMTWLFLSADNLLAGYFLGADELGAYSLGFNLATMLPGMIVSILSVVAYPAFSALQNNIGNIGNSLLKLQSLVAVIIFPLAFGLSAVGPLAVSLLYGERWAGLPVVILFLSIMPGLSHLWSLNADAFRAIGRPDLWTKAAGLTLVILLPLLILGGQLGLQGFVIMRFLGAFLLPLFNSLFARRNLDLSLHRQWSTIKTPFIAASLMYLMVYLVIHWLERASGLSGWSELFLAILVGAGTYFLAVRLINPPLLQNTWFLMRRALRGA